MLSRMALLEHAPSRGTRAAALDRIRASLDSLSPSERRVAERVLEEPAQVIALAISEFAALCGVAQPTVSRFSRSVGFSSYVALRLGVAADFAADVSTPGAAPAAGFGDLVGGLRSDATASEAARAVRYATRVEIWASPVFAAAGDLLSTRLAQLDLAASVTVTPEYCADRAAALPSGSVVILLAATGDEHVWLGPVATARESAAHVVYAAARSASRLRKMADMFIPLPDTAGPALTGPLLAEVFAELVRDLSYYAGPSGPASPWRNWPDTREVLLPTSGSPIPALLLSQPDSAKKRSLVIFYPRIGACKEQVAPPRGAEDYVSPHFVAALLNAGHDVLLPDAPAHGARKRVWEDTDELFRAGLQDQGPDYLEQISTETPDLIDAALGLGVASSPAQIAVVGQSGGGMQTLLKLAADPRIGCGVAVMPICDITLLSQFADLGSLRRTIAGSPSPRMGSLLAPRPLLLIAGGQDDTAPASHIETFHQGIAPAYRRAGAAQNLNYLRLDDVAHRFDERQVDAMLAWLDQHLRRTPRAAKPRRRKPAKAAAGH
jgi:DNA-binding MurR/RpiR family transcriptional regulator/dienelactone hydrolase